MKLTSRLGTLAVAVLAGVLGGIVGSRNYVEADSPKAIRASKFELVNAAGVTLATWEAGRGSDAHLKFLPSRGHAAVDVGVLSDGSPVIQLAGRDGKRRIVLELDQFDRPMLGMGDDHWEGRVELGFKGSDVPDRSEDNWGLSVMAIGSERPVAAIGVIKGDSTAAEGVLTLSGKQIH